MLDRNPDNYFADVEQAAFNPAQLRARHRAVARQDAAGTPVRLRRRAPLPAGHQPHPAAGEPAARGRQRRELRSRRLHARSTATAARAKNYEPNSFGGPAETGEPLYAPLASRRRSAAPTSGTAARATTSCRPARCTGVMDEAARARLVDNIAGSLAQVSQGRDRRALDRRTSANADPEYGERVEAAVKQRRG